MVIGSQRNGSQGSGSQGSGSQGSGIALADVPAVPPPSRVSAESEVLSTRIERAVRRKTNGKVHGLKVEVRRDRVVMQGHCGTFYCKQLAQQAALSLLDGQELQDMIEVW